MINLIYVGFNGFSELLRISYFQYYNNMTLKYSITSDRTEHGKSKFDQFPLV